MFWCQKLLFYHKRPTEKSAQSPLILVTLHISGIWDCSHNSRQCLRYDTVHSDIFSNQSGKNCIKIVIHGPLNHTLTICAYTWARLKSYNLFTPVTSIKLMQSVRAEFIGNNYSNENLIPAIYPSKLPLLKWASMIRNFRFIWHQISSPGWKCCCDTFKHKTVHCHLNFEKYFLKFFIKKLRLWLCYFSDRKNFLIWNTESGTAFDSVFHADSIGNHQRNENLIPVTIPSKLPLLKWNVWSAIPYFSDTN